MYLALNDSIAFIAHHQIGEVRSYDLSTDPPELLDTYHTGSYPSYLSLQDELLICLELDTDSLMVFFSTLS